MLVALPEIDGGDQPHGLRRPVRPRPAAEGCARARGNGQPRDARRYERARCLPTGSPSSSLLRRSGRRTPGRRWCSSASRRMPARSAPPPISSVFDSLHNTLTGAGRRGLHGQVAGERRRPARGGARRQRPAIRPAGQRRRLHPGRRHAAARRPPRRDRGAVGTGARPAPVRRRAASSCSAPVRQRLRRRAARLRLRGRPDAAAVRARLRADPRLHGLLPLDARGFPRRRAAAFRHPRGAGIHARQAVRPRRPIAGPTG